MCFQRIACAASLYLTLAHFSFAVSAESIEPNVPEEVLVSRVNSGNSFTIRERDGDELLCLYGILVPESKFSEGEQSKEDLKSLIEGQRIRIDRRAKFGKISFVSVYLSDDTNLAEYLVSAGKATWDRFLAPKEESLRDAETLARSKGAGTWATTSHMSPVNSETQQSAEAKLHEFKRRRMYKEQAFFDAAFERWVSLAASDRDDILGSLQNGRESIASRVQEKVSGLEDAATGIEAAEQSKQIEVQSGLKRVQSIEQEGQRKLERTYDDPSLQLNTHMARSMGAYRDARRNYGLPENPYINASVDGYEAMAVDDEIRVENEARSIRKANAAARKGELSRTNSLEMERQSLVERSLRVRNEQRVAENLSTTVQSRLAAEIGLCRALEDARSSGYKPFTIKTKVVESSTVDETTRLEVDLSSELWRLDIDSIDGTTDSELLVYIYQGDSPRPFKFLSGDATDHKRFLIVEDAGRFRIEVKNPQGTQYRLFVYEIDYR